METKEKNREAGRQSSQRRQTGQKTAPPDPSRKRTRQPEQQTAATRSASGQKTAATRKAAPTGKDNGSGQRRQPADTRQAPSGQTRAQRPGKTSAVRSAPQGTGPRKSAPQRSRQEATVAKKTAGTQPVKHVEKKTGILGFLSGNSGKPKRKLTPEERAEKRRREEAAAEEKKKRREIDTPAVVYTQPVPFNRDRFLIQLLTIAAVVVAVILGMSVFFKVKTITVAGAETYSAYAIQQASGIVEGDNLLTFSKARASARIQAEHAYVDDVRIGIKLPDTVIIYIEELDVAYAINSINDGWWLINSDGKVVDQINQNESGNYTVVEGVALDSPQIGLTAAAAEEVPAETLESGEPVPITVTGAQRLSAALQILKALEENDIVGEAASVNVASLEDITLWYGNRYEVLLGNIDRMDYKIACMNDAILQMSDYQSGILDVTFTTWINQVGYTPFG